MKYFEVAFVVLFLVCPEDASGEANVAFNKTVTLSSLHSSVAPGRLAVDGNKTGDWYVDGCACSQLETNPWILVDLEKEYKISALYILNRQDEKELAERLSKLHIEVGLLRENLTEILYYADTVGADITFPFDPVLCGRFVKIWIEKTDFLTICEIEIYGSTGEGNWTDWGEWSSCSKSCGNGSAFRRRSCYGSDCCAAAEEKITCNNYECPGSISDGLCSNEPHDCQDIDTTWSGVYHVTPLGTFSGFDVYCDMVTDGGGWLVFQRRADSLVDFYKRWKDYLVGFGSVRGTHWLGLRKLKSIVDQGHYELRIDLEDEEGQNVFAKYAVFSLGDLVDQYPVIADGYFGTAGDALSKYTGIPFTAKDKDITDTHCSMTYKSAWWFSNCSGPWLNGRYPSENTDNSSASSMQWTTSSGKSYTVMKSEMKIRRI